jgi:hypothetical protein
MEQALLFQSTDELASFRKGGSRNGRFQVGDEVRLILDVLENNLDRVLQGTKLGTHLFSFV